MTLARRSDYPLGTPTDLHTTWQVLAGGAQSCAEALIEIATNGRVEAARVSAAKTVLEMAGFKSPDTVQVLPPEYDGAVTSAVTGDSPTIRIRNRLAALATTRPKDDEIADAVIVQVDDDGYEVVDAEPIDDEPGSPGQT